MDKFLIVIKNGVELEQINECVGLESAQQNLIELKNKLKQIEKAFFEEIQNVSPKTFEDLEEDAMNSFINLAHPYNQLHSTHEKTAVMNKILKTFSHDDVELHFRSYLKQLEIVKKI